MDEQLTELEKLQQAAQLIEEMSQGRLQVCPSAVEQVYIQARDDSSLGMDMRIDSIPGQPRYQITFSHRFGGWGRTWMWTGFGRCCLRWARPMR